MDSWKRSRAHTVASADAGQALTTVKIGVGGLDSAVKGETGRYVLHEVLGAGGFGRVYRAHDPKLGRPVAIKAVTVRSAAATNTHWMAQAEARTLARLSHPNVVSVYDVSSRRVPAAQGSTLSGGVDRDQLLIVMELVRGRTLADWVAACRPSPSEVLDAYMQAGEGLDAAHRAGILHLDFKPRNAMRAEDGRVVVLDFGLARLLLEVEHAAAETLPGAPLPLTLSRECFAGTPMYMPPEQFRGRRCTPRSDVYAFAGSLYGALWGQMPFCGHTAVELYCDKLAGPKLAPRSRVDRRIAKVLLRGMAPDPRDRWPSMRAMLDALARARAPRRLGLRSSSAIGGALAVCALMFGMMPAQPQCEEPAHQLEQRWQAQRGHLERALHMGGANRVAADATLLRVDDHVDGWVRDYSATCDARRPASFAEQTRACIERSGHALNARLHAVMASPGLAGRFTALLERLPLGAECSSDELRRRDALPSDVIALESIAALRDWVDGDARGERTPQRVEHHVNMARAVGHLPTLAEVQLHAGNIAVDAHRPARARKRYELAFSSAIAGGADRVALAASIAAIGVVPEVMPLRQARRWAATALSLCERLGNVERDRARAHNYLAQALVHAGHLQEARQIIGPALEFAQQAPADDSLATGILHSAGVLEVYIDDHEAAIEHLSEAAGRARQLNQHGASTVEISLALAAAYRYDDRREQAERLLARLVNDPWIDRNARTRVQLALALVIADRPARLDESLMLLRGVQAEVHGVEGDHSIPFADTMATKGQVLRKTGRLDEARAAYRTARSIYLRTEGVGGARLLNADRGLAEVAAQRRIAPT